MKFFWDTLDAQWEHLDRALEQTSSLEAPKDRTADYLDLVEFCPLVFDLIFLPLRAIGYLIGSLL